MTDSIRLLNDDDNRELLALAATSDTGSAAFRVDRGPDFFALSRVLGDCRHFGFFRAGRLVGCIGIARQRRFLGGKPTELSYIHDVRVAPDCRGSVAYGALVRHVIEEWPERSRWAFASILDSNRHTGVLTRACRLLASARPLGRTAHVGVPLFQRQAGDATRVVRLGPDEAWPAYVALARSVDFAPADEARFRCEPGIFLGVEGRAGLAAVCKVVDQDAARRIVATQPFPLPMRLLNAACAWRGRARLPRPGGVFRHAYLAFCVGAESGEQKGAFLAHLSHSSDHDFTYVFLGLTEDEAKRSRGVLRFALSSTTYAYGDIPADVRFSFRELTLI